MLIHIIRHGKTKGNEEGRYIGSTDEPLSSGGIAELERYKQKKLYPACGAVYASPMRRCLETADILYPGRPRVIVPALAEYHFGIFEGKNYGELNGTAAYQEFIDSGGESPIPGAPPLEEYRAGCVAAFHEILTEAECGEIAVICHGGTIMAILQHIDPLEDLYGYRVKNGGGYTVEWRPASGAFGAVCPIYI